MVGAVVEQVYSSTFKFRLLKKSRNMSPGTLYFTAKRTQMRLVAGLCPYPLGELVALPQSPDPLAELKGRGKRKGSEWETGGGRKGREKERGGNPLPMSEVR